MIRIFSYLLDCTCGMTVASALCLSSRLFLPFMPLSRTELLVRYGGVQCTLLTEVKTLCRCCVNAIKYSPNNPCIVGRKVGTNVPLAFEMCTYDRANSLAAIVGAFKVTCCTQVPGIIGSTQQDVPCAKTIASVCSVADFSRLVLMVTA